MAIAMVAGNWKMNTTVNEARELIASIRLRLNSIDGVEKIVCPPFVSLSPVSEMLAGSEIRVGAQNMFHQEEGAYTGEISPRMLVGLCQFVILGHSERRQLFGEIDETVNRKLLAARAAGIRPILCVGEVLKERDQGMAESVVESQLRNAIATADSPGDLVIAYEPVWAIGTGRAATPETAQRMMAHLRQVLGSHFGDAASSTISLLYGGSVNAENAALFFREQDIDGALVGGASLDAESFATIVEGAARAKG